MVWRVLCLFKLKCLKTVRQLVLSQTHFIVALKRQQDARWSTQWHWRFLMDLIYKINVWISLKTRLIFIQARLIAGKCSLQKGLCALKTKLLRVTAKSCKDPKQYTHNENNCIMKALNETTWKQDNPVFSNPRRFLFLFMPEHFVPFKFESQSSILLGSYLFTSSDDIF